MRQSKEIIGPDMMIYLVRRAMSQLYCDEERITTKEFYRNVDEEYLVYAKTTASSESAKPTGK